MAFWDDDDSDSLKTKSLWEEIKVEKDKPESADFVIRVKEKPQAEVIILPKPPKQILPKKVEDKKPTTPVYVVWQDGQQVYVDANGKRLADYTPPTK